MSFDRLLCGSEGERSRLLDLSRRMRAAEFAGAGMLIAALAIGAPTFGWQPLIPLAVAGALFAVTSRQLHRTRLPEFLLSGCWTLTQLAILAAVLLAHGPSLYLLPMFIFPTLLASAVFPLAPAAVALLFTAALMVAGALLGNPAQLDSDPFILVFPLATMFACAFPASAVQSLEVRSRQSAVVDHLTGVLNRVALEHRIAELTHQAQHAQSPVAIVLADLDHFKSINDRHGHDVGDVVLRTAAQRLAETVGAAEPVYRLGGEEFVILLADTRLDGAIELAERLRTALREEPIEGIHVTASFGVAASTPQTGFDYEQLFGAADVALYTAKHAGRDRVHTPNPAPPQDGGAAGAQLWLERRHREQTHPATPLVSPEDVLSRWRERLDEEQGDTGSWLVRDDVEREHLLDLNRLIHGSNRPAYAVAFAAVVAAAPTYGWLILLPPVLAAIIYNVVEHRLDRFRRPEYMLGLMWMVAQGSNALGICLGRLHVHDLPLFAPVLFVIMVIGSSAAFTRRGVIVGVAYAMALVVVTDLVINAPLVAANPGIAALQVALVAATGLVGFTAGRSAVDHRGAAVVDPLTGLFTRGALVARAAEISHHAKTTGQQVAVIVCDIDHFKAINDAHGHAAGDEVLQETGYRLRKRLRAFEGAYRIGGEEFVILLPGVSLEEARAVAQRACSAIHDTPLAGVAATMSFGVAATEPGQPFEYAKTFRAADAALYEAKREGRNRVRCSEPVPVLAA